MIFITDESDLKFRWTEYPIQALYFYISQMPFHQKIMNVIAKLEDKYKQVDFYAIDAEQFSTQCVRFSIISVPTLVVLKVSGETKRIEGSVKTQHFIELFDDICTL